jgi:two-component system, sensor histidine kinase and response regulator
MMETVPENSKSEKAVIPSIKILIVDDRMENLLTLESIIEKHGRIIVKAKSGNEALRLAIRETISLILLDIQMPDIDGLEVARLLRSNKQTRHIPIIFVSAVNKNDMVSLDEFEEGTVDFLCKPLHMEETRLKVALFEKICIADKRRMECSAYTEKITRELDRFLYIISHDLKAPLRAMDNLANWIAEDLGSNASSDTQENLALMRSRVNRMNSLLEGALEYSRISRLSEPLEKIEVRSLVHAIFESLVPPQGFVLKADDLPFVSAGKTDLYKIFYNLIKNCIVHHHQPAKGSITIKSIEEEDNWVFCVSDNGPGIKPQYHGKIFEIFSTVKSKDEQPSAGVGLAVVKKLLDDRDCIIWIEQNDEKGAAFSFTWKK